MDKSVNLSRRQSLTVGAVAAGALFVETVMTGCEKDTVKSSDASYELDISTVPILAVEGGAVLKQLGELNGGKPVVIIRSSEKVFNVFSSVCTHQGCQVVAPDAPGAPIICNCHNTKFSSTDGSVITGPAPNPLAKFATSFDAEKNKLTIK